MTTVAAESGLHPLPIPIKTDPKRLTSNALLPKLSVENRPLHTIISDQAINIGRFLLSITINSTNSKTNIFAILTNILQSGKATYAWAS